MLCVTYVCFYVNNMYWIPVAMYSFLPCLGDEVAKGIELMSVLVEGKDEVHAVARLMNYPGRDWLLIIICIL